MIGDVLRPRGRGLFPRGGGCILTVAAAMAAAALLWPAPARAQEAKHPLLPSPPNVGKAPPPFRAGATPPPLGVNIEGASVTARSNVFVDVMKTTLRWGSANAPWDQTAPVDADGWPTGDAGVFAIDGTLAFNRYAAGGVTNPIAAPDLGGVYRLSFRCGNPSGVTIDAWGEAVSNIQRNTSTGIVTANITVSPGANKNLFLSFRNTGGGVRDVRLLRPGYSAADGQTFTNEFLNMLAPFSVLRCMDLLHTNSAPTYPAVTTWADRRRVTDARQVGETGKGVAWEYLCELAAVTGKDLWINIPVAADDTYVQNLATLLRDQLPAITKVYVEYSNEVWNGAFPQNPWNIAAAQAEVAAYGTTGDPIRLNENVGDWRDDPSSANYRGHKRVAKRLMQISAIFREVFGETGVSPQDPAARVRPVLASQLGFAYALELQLLFLQRYYGPPSGLIYGVAGAPYINLGGSQNSNTLTVNNILDRYEQSATALASGGLRSYATLAAYYGVQPMLYEAGTDNASSDGQPHSLAAKYAADYHPRTGAAITTMHTNWYAMGGGLAMYFTNCSSFDQYGMWGLTENPADLTAAKYAAVLALAQGPLPPLTGGFTVAGNALSFVPAPGYVDSITGRATTRMGADGMSYIDTITPLTHFDYLLNVAGTGTYRVSVEVASTYNGGQLRLSADNDPARTFTLAVPNTGGGQNWTSTATVNVPLTAGLHGLRLERADVTFGAGANGFGIRRIALKPAGLVRIVPLTLGQYQGDTTQVPVTVHLCAPGSTTPLETLTAYLDAGGTLAFATERRGTFDVAVKGPTHLKRRFSGVAIVDDEVSVSGVTLTNGDADGDNVVNAGDVAIVSRALGSPPGSIRWTPNADLNGDGQVNQADYDIVLANFRQRGDP
jgi:Carbohydrate binding module (family 6).